MEKKPFFNPFVEPVLFYFLFFLGIPSFLYMWRVLSHPLSNPLNMSILFVILVGGGLFLPRWGSNIYNLVGGLISRRMLPRNQLPSWRLKIPFPFVRIQMGKIMVLGLGGLTFSQYYFLDVGSDAILGLLVFSFLLSLTIISLRLSSSDGTPDSEVSIDERREFALQTLRKLNPRIDVSFFNSPFPVAYARKNKIFISKNALKLPLGDLERLLYHEYAHTLQKHLKYFLMLLTYFILILLAISLIQISFFNVLFWTTLPASVLFWFYALLSSRSLPLWYLLAVIVPFFFFRWIVWNMELNAEAWACAQMGRDVYSEAMAKPLESLDEWRKTYGRVPGFGWDRFYYFYPPIIYQITKALDSIHPAKSLR